MNNEIRDKKPIGLSPVSVY